MNCKILFLFVSFVAAFGHATQSRMGAYEVPAPDNLKPYATYQMVITEDAYKKGPNIFTFPLPQSLIGEKRVFTIVRVDDTTTWIGENVSGVCEVIEKYFKCTVKFRNLTIDLQQVNEAVRAEFPNDIVNKRMAVAQLFAAEPIGIVTYEMTDEEQKLQ